MHCPERSTARTGVSPLHGSAGVGTCRRGWVAGRRVTVLNSSDRLHPAARTGGPTLSEGLGSVFSMRTATAIVAHIGHARQSYRLMAHHSSIHPKKRAQDALEGRTQPNFESGCVPPRHPGYRLTSSLLPPGAHTRTPDPRPSHSPVHNRPTSRKWILQS